MCIGGNTVMKYTPLALIMLLLLSSTTGCLTTPAPGPYTPSRRYGDCVAYDTHYLVCPIPGDTPARQAARLDAAMAGFYAETRHNAATSGTRSTYKPFWGWRYPARRY